MSGKNARNRRGFRGGSPVMPAQAVPVLLPGINNFVTSPQSRRLMIG
jgi:hypothetical protein